VHTTIARNSGGDGSGIYINGNNVILTNTILVSQTIGIAVNAGSTARLNGVLWFGNGSNTSGAGLISVTNEVTGNPTFKSDGYHLCPSSAAKDTGVNAGVTSDIDGEARPWGSGFDIGANEYAGVKPKPVAGLRVIKAITDTGAITATLIWQPPADVVTYTLYYASIPITDGNWNEATELVNGIAGSTTAYTASVPYGGGYVYFASKYWDTCGIASLLSGNAFWPHLDVYLPLMFKGNP
jgi:hypothetical protein